MPDTPRLTFIPDHPHPLFALEKRRLNRTRTPAQMVRWTRWIVTRVLLFGVGAWLVALSNAYLGPSSTTTIDSVAFASLNMVILLGLVSVTAVTVLDFTCLSSAADGIQPDTEGDFWDLVRLSADDERAVIDAKHAMVRLRTWRMTWIVIGLRLVAVIVYLLHALFVPVERTVSTRFSTGIPPTEVTTAFEDYLDLWHVLPSAALTLTGMLLLFAAFFLFEPWWRARAMTALAVNSALRDTTAVGSLVAVGSVMGLWLLQLAIYALGVRLTLSLNETLRPQSTFVLLLPLVALIAVTAGFYALVRWYNLRRAVRFAFGEGHA